MSMRHTTTVMAIAALALLAAACGGHDPEPAHADLPPVTAALDLSVLDRPSGARGANQFGGLAFGRDGQNGPLKPQVLE